MSVYSHLLRSKEKHEEAVAEHEQAEERLQLVAAAPLVRLAPAEELAAAPAVRLAPQAELAQRAELLAVLAVIGASLNAEKSSAPPVCP